MKDGDNNDSHIILTRQWHFELKCGYNRYKTHRWTTCLNMDANTSCFKYTHIHIYVYVNQTKPNQANEITKTWQINKQTNKQKQAEKKSDNNKSIFYSYANIWHFYNMSSTHNQFSRLSNVGRPCVATIAIAIVAYLLDCCFASFT